MPITILCPNCKQELTINPSKNVEERVADCPKCKQVICIGNCLPKYSLRVSTNAYQLHFGKQWIGRNVPDTDVDISIEDNTNKMSRRHAIIHLQCDTQGVVLTLEDHGKNPTEIQNVELENGDIIYLNINDSIKMGGTKMYISNEYGDQTI